MSNPWIPTYPGAWDRLFANTVSGAPGAQGSPDSVSDGPLMSFNGPSAMRGHTLSDPMPMIVGRLAAAVGVLQLADNPPLSASSVRDQLIGSANSTINQVLEDYCGTPPRLIPWPWPGPPHGSFPSWRSSAGLPTLPRRRACNRAFSRSQAECWSAASGGVQAEHESRGLRRAGAKGCAIGLPFDLYRRTSCRRMTIWSGRCCGGCARTNTERGLSTPPKPSPQNYWSRSDRIPIRG